MLDEVGETRLNLGADVVDQAVDRRLQAQPAVGLDDGEAVGAAAGVECLQRRAHLRHLFGDRRHQASALALELLVARQGVEKDFGLVRDPLARRRERRKVGLVEGEDVAALTRFGMRHGGAEPRDLAQDVVVAAHLGAGRHRAALHREDEQTRERDQDRRGDEA